MDSSGHAGTYDTMDPSANNRRDRRAPSVAATRNRWSPVIAGKVRSRVRTQRHTVAGQNGAEALKHELVALFQYIRRVRQEIAAILRPADGDHQFDGMADQLDAIVGATEEATDTIMEAMENNDEILARLREGITDADHLACLDRIGANGAAAKFLSRARLAVVRSPPRFQFFQERRTER